MLRFDCAWAPPPSSSDYQRLAKNIYPFFSNRRFLFIISPSLSTVRLGMPHPIYTHLVNLSHSIDLKSFDFAQNLKISISISAFCSILEEDGFTFGSPCWMCEMFLQKPQDSELLDVTNTNFYSKTPFVSEMYIF